MASGVRVASGGNLGTISTRSATPQTSTCIKPLTPTRQCGAELDLLVRRLLAIAKTMERNDIGTNAVRGDMRSGKGEAKG